LCSALWQEHPRGGQTTATTAQTSARRAALSVREVAGERQLTMCIARAASVMLPVSDG
jgi:hypothetical protein